MVRAVGIGDNGLVDSISSPKRSGIFGRETGAGVDINVGGGGGGAGVGVLATNGGGETKVGTGGEYVCGADCTQGGKGGGITGGGGDKGGVNELGDAKGLTFPN